MIEPYSMLVFDLTELALMLIIHEDSESVFSPRSIDSETRSISLLYRKPVVCSCSKKNMKVAQERISEKASPCGINYVYVKVPIDFTELLLCRLGKQSCSWLKMNFLRYFLRHSTGWVGFIRKARWKTSLCCTHVVVLMCEEGSYNRKSFWRRWLHNFCTKLYCSHQKSTGDNPSCEHWIDAGRNLVRRNNNKPCLAHH